MVVETQTQLPTAQIISGAEETCGETLHWPQEQSYYLTNRTFEATSKFKRHFLEGYIRIHVCRM